MITIDEEAFSEIKKLGSQNFFFQQVIDEWIDGYKVNKDSSLLQLMQFFINAAGCKGKISPQMQADMEHAEIIRKMTEEFDEVKLLLKCSHWLNAIDRPLTYI